MIDECLSGKGRPKNTTPDFIKMESGIICAAIGVQGGSCAFVDAFFTILQPCFDDFLGAFLDFLTGKPAYAKFNFKIAEKVFETLAIIADAGTLLEAINPAKGIKAVDFCRDKPKSLPDETALKLGIAAALLCNPDQLTGQIADIWHYDNWYKFCECVPVSDDPPPLPKFKLYPPQSSCGIADSRFTAQLFASQAKNENLSVNSLLRLSTYVQELNDRGLSEGLDFWIRTSPPSGTDNTLFDRAARVPYGYAPFFSCCEQLYSLRLQKVQILFGRTGQDIGSYYGGDAYVNPVMILVSTRIGAIGSLCNPGITKDLKCRDFPQLCPCQEVTAEPFINIDCETKDAKPVTYLNDKCPTYDMTVGTFKKCDEPAPLVISYPYYDPDQSL